MKYIYRLISPDNKAYVGQTSNLVVRKSKMRTGLCSKQRKLHESLQRHGFDKHNFQIAHELPNDVSQTVLDDYERFYIQSYIDAGFESLNLQTGGIAGNTVADETRKKMSERQKGIPLEERIGKEAADRQKARMSELFGSRKLSDDHKRKIGLANRKHGRYANQS